MKSFKNRSSFYDIKPPTAKMEEIIDSDSDSEPIIDEKGKLRKIEFLSFLS